MTVLLAVEEDIPESQVDQINKVLSNHKEFKAYKMVNWADYHGKGMGDNDASYDDEDDEGHGGDGMIEVADNYMRAPRNAILKNRRGNNQKKVKSEEELKEDYSKMDKEKVEATIMGIEASVTAWLNQERSKQNMYLRKKMLGESASSRISQKG